MDCKIAVKQYFSKIKEGDGTPLYLQLQQAVREMIAELPDNSLFPSERELAEELKINRRTLRKALEPFIAEGRLLRSQRGTIVHHPRLPAATHEGKIHPFTMAIAAPTFWPKTKLRIMLYESLPFQQKFWQEIIELFNLKNPRLELESFYPQPLFDDPEESYWQEFAKENFDFVHLPVSYRWKANIGNMLAEIPAELRQYEATEGFATTTFAQTVPNLLQYGFPFAFSPRIYCWNRRYVDYLKLDIHNQSIEEILERGQALPDDVATAATFYDLCLDLAVPERFTPEEIQEQLKIILKRLRLLLARNKKLFCPYPFPNFHHNINEEKMLLHSSYAPVLRIHEKDMKHFLFSPVPIRRGGLFWGGSSTLGLSSQGSRNYNALLFLKFMLSEEIQRKIATDLLMAPVRRAEWPVMADALRMDRDKLAESLEHCRENPRAYPPPIGLTLMRFPEIMAGKTSDDEALKLVLNYYKDVLQQ